MANRRIYDNKCTNFYAKQKESYADTIQVSVSILRAVSRYHSYINTATQIIEAYKGNEPLSQYLKKFFSTQKKYGSKDRKIIAHCCYVFFRVGRALPEMAIGEKILTALFLYSTERLPILEHLKPEWSDKIELSFNDKNLLLDQKAQLADIFPWPELLSKGIDQLLFTQSFLHQPDLFIRVRPGQKDKVFAKLQLNKVEYKLLSDEVLAIDNSTPIDNILEPDKEVVIQDLSSQRVSNFYPGLTNHNKAWDCCAASGGKSIQLIDTYPDLDLTVTDIRDSILFNLRKRFERAGLKNYRALTVDLTKKSNIPFKENSFDLIMADVPCTGSGTWSRTPEQLYYFNPDRIEYYTQLQKNIVSNILPYLKSGGHLLYSTCSVFSKENEEVVKFIGDNFTIEIKKMQVITGYTEKADTMFAALLQKTS